MYTVADVSETSISGLAAVLVAPRKGLFVYETTRTVNGCAVWPAVNGAAACGTANPPRLYTTKEEVDDYNVRSVGWLPCWAA